jgi:UDP-N-acetylmuramoylalanine--D-glutamate ligase
MGISIDTLQNGLRSFPGLAHRMEQVGRRGNVLFVNDSKGTNADAAAHALSSFGDIFWIAGGKPKQGGITGLAEYFPRIRKAYLIGEAAGPFAGTLQGKVPFVVAGTLDRAVELAARDAEAAGLAEPVVLLSPACASYDQFRNFELRGAAFRDAVKALPGLAPA